MSTKYKIIIIVIALAGSFAAGRFLTPVKVVTEIKTVEVEKKVQDVEKNTHTKTVVVEVKKPDGTDTKTTTITNDSNLKKDTVITDEKSSDTIKTVERESGFLYVDVMSGVNISNPSSGLLYGISVNKSIIGPLAIGLWGMSNGTTGASVGIKF